MHTNDVREVTNSHPSLLLRAVAEELKLPLLQISREAELRDLKSEIETVDLKSIRSSADIALLLIDSYLLGLELNEAQTELELEPISLSGALNDTAHSLSRFARQYNVTFELADSGRHSPVMAHARGLKAALLSLGYALVSLPPTETSFRQVILGVHQSARGTVAGIYGDFENLAHNNLKQAKLLCGHARQPFSTLSSGSAAGVFVADTIFQAMNTNLTVSRHQKHTGLAATLQPSNQLALV